MARTASCDLCEVGPSGCFQLFGDPDWKGSGPLGVLNNSLRRAGLSDNIDNRDSICKKTLDVWTAPHFQLFGSSRDRSDLEQRRQTEREIEDKMMYGPLCTEFYDADKTFAPEDEITFYKSLFKHSDLILELMCGSGRLLIPLLKEGYTIHGIDNSTHMLKSCRARASTLGLTPTLFESSIEGASLPGRYDAILIPLGSFQLFFPRVYAMQMLEKIETFLKPNGKLVMDMFIPWQSLWENAGAKPFFREVQTGENTMIKIESVGKGIINKYEQYTFETVIYTKTVNGQVVAREEEQMHVSWYYRYEMELILEKYGFKNIRVENRYLNQADQMTFIAELK